FHAQPKEEIAQLKQAIQSLEQRVATLEEIVTSLEPVRKEYEQRQLLIKEIQEIGGIPGSIESSEKPVFPDTPLAVGQLLQVEWGGDWWAARVLDVLSNSEVRIHYLGWPNDEVVSRSRLQLDPDAITNASKSIRRIGALWNLPGGPITPTGTPVLDQT